MIFVVGDIHGEITKLQQLVKNILAADSSPSFVFIGDYIDKGEDAKATLDYLEELSKKYNCIFLTGNHEYIWLNLKEGDEKWMEYLKKYGGNNTLQSFGCKTMLETKEKMIEGYSSFFSSLQSYYQYKNYIVVHSGIKPEHYKIKPAEIKLQDLLFNRYDFISSSSCYLNEFTVIFGHTGFYTPYNDGYKLGVDTAACFLESQPLTAFNADENYFINSFNRVTELKEIDKTVCPNILRNKPWRAV
jgi:serine/threonine protein phosphatase 1